MYDALTARYTFACPARGEARVPLSAFRRVDRMPGPAHPAVFRVAFACVCGGEHVGIVAHDELDWAPLGLEAGSFLNVMTATIDDAAGELADLAARRIGAGEWPWTFYCYPEERPRPGFPSAFTLVAPGERAFGVAVRCAACSRLSVNLVSVAHLDVPFHNDSHVGVVEHFFSEDMRHTVEQFTAELYSAHFDARRLTLD
jgi:hypothetical protein